MSDINNMTSENDVIDKDKKFVKDFVLAMERIKEEEYNNLSEKTKVKISQFIDTALAENMTEDELVQCLKCMPSKLAELVCIKLPKELNEKISNLLNKIYTDDFIASCKKSKMSVPKIKTISSYKQAFNSNNNIRFFDYDEIFHIALGLKYPLYKLVFGNIDECENDYQKVLKAIHAIMFKNNYRNQEYKFKQIWNEKFIDVALDNQKELLNRHPNI